MSLDGIEMTNKNYLDYPKQIYMNYYLQLLEFLGQNELIYDVGLIFFIKNLFELLATFWNYLFSFGLKKRLRKWSTRLSTFQD